MQKNPFQSRAFRELEESWEKILDGSGLKNIEPRRRGRRLKYRDQWRTYSYALRGGPRKFSKCDLIHRQTTVEYYDWARTLLHTYSFKNEGHRRIWELHCEGLSKRKIEKLISDYPYKTKWNRPYSYKRENIANIINQIKGSKK